MCSSELGMFSFRVIDLGVMVPCDQILRGAIAHKAGTVYHLDFTLSVGCANSIFIRMVTSKARQIVWGVSLNMVTFSEQPGHLSLSNNLSCGHRC